MPATRSAAPVLLLLAALGLLLPACSALERVTDDDTDRPPPAEEPRADPGEGDETPSEDPPEEPRTVQGFRIQILTTDDKDAADQCAAEAQEQWGAPVDVAWKAPYYRVRVGAFASRAAAQPRLDAVQEQYPDAFLVPDTVTIRPE